MNSLRRNFLTLLILLVCHEALMAQQAILSGGGSKNSEYGSVNFSIGQIFFNTRVGEPGKVFEGVQQPYEVILIDGLEEMASIHHRVFPNPYSDRLTLTINSLDDLPLNCTIHNMHGMRLRELKVVSRESSIPAEDLVPGTYLLSLTRNGKVLTIFKIVKQ